MTNFLFTFYLLFGKSVSTEPKSAISSLNKFPQIYEFNKPDNKYRIFVFGVVANTIFYFLQLVEKGPWKSTSTETGSNQRK